MRPAVFNQNILNTALGDLPMGGIRYIQKIGSTNDLAISWAGEGAFDLSLVITDEQTNGRGRNGRNWYSPVNTSLTFSLILKPDQAELQYVGLFTALAALSVVQAIKGLPGCITPRIKWPNDVMVNGHKVSGVLTETIWIGEQLESLVIGVGINVTPESVPPIELLNYPAASLEDIAHRKIDRLAFLHDFLEGIICWRRKMGERSFLDAWFDSLAYRGENVKIWSDNFPTRTGIITGLEKNGGLILKDPEGVEFTIWDGELHLEHGGL